MSGAPDFSVLGQLAKRVQQIRDEELLELPVPRITDPEVVVRYRPLANKELGHLAVQIDKTAVTKRADAAVDLNADLLIKACVGVFARFPGDDTRYSLRPGDPEGTLTTFDPELAENLGLDEKSTARQVVRALFITEGDILSAAQALTEWSGYRETEALESVSGE